jgi:hypothetical protein
VDLSRRVMFGAHGAGLAAGPSKHKGVFLVSD